MESFDNWNDPVAQRLITGLFNKKILEFEYKNEVENVDILWKQYCVRLEDGGYRDFLLSYRNNHPLVRTL